MLRWTWTRYSARWRRIPIRLHWHRVVGRTVVADVERVHRAGRRRDVGEVRLGAGLGRGVDQRRQRTRNLRVAETHLIQ